MTVFEDERQEWNGRRVKIILRGIPRILYAGTIIYLADESIILIDRYGNRVIIAIDQISHMERCPALPEDSA